jgi:type IV secretory pathway TraG/TraD family ATPase VirD4
MTMRERQSVPVPVPIPQPAASLGTASWHHAPAAVTHAHKPGSFLLGRLGDGRTASVRDDRHVLIASGTRGGKGVSHIIPNLCTWPGSAVIIDPKGENALVTARRRAGGSAYCEGMRQPVYILDPFNIVQTDEDDFADLKASLNPLHGISEGRVESVEEAARIADALVLHENSNDPFWEDAARDFLKAVILHVATSRHFQKSERTLVTVRRLAMAGDQSALRQLRMHSAEDKTPSPFALLFAAMQANPAFGGVIADAGASLAATEKTAPRLFGSIAQVARTNTEFIDSAGIKAVLGSSSFNLAELKRNANGATLYLCLPQRYMETHARWLRMMTTLTLTEMESIRHQPRCGYPVLMVLDEFPALRRMRVLENAAAQIAGFGVKLVMAVQTLAQLKDIYKDNWETLVANAGAKLFYCNDDHFTRDYVSKLVGEGVVKTYAETYSQARGVSGSRTESSTWGTSQSSSISAGPNGVSTSSTFGSSQSNSVSHTKGWNASESKGWNETIHKRALISPDEVGRLFGDRDKPRVLALLSGEQPLALSRIIYYKDEGLLGLFDRHPDHPPPLTLRELRKARELRNALAQAKAEKKRIAVNNPKWGFREYASWVIGGCDIPALEVVCYMLYPAIGSYAGILIAKAVSGVDGPTAFYVAMFALAGLAIYIVEDVWREVGSRLQGGPPTPTVSG